MSFSLSWIPAVLEAAGLKVATTDGWQDRGRGEMGQVLGVMIHHTAGPRSGNMPSLKTLINGRADLPGPLAQLGVGRDGCWYVIAAGRANHAGSGSWQGINLGNTHFIGIECENTGLDDDLPWPAVQTDALRRGVAALLRHAGLAADCCMGHKEYAPGRKIDPRFDMNAFRRQLADTLAGLTPPPPLIPASEPSAGGRPTLRRGSDGAAVSALQKALGVLPADGLFGAKTEAAVRAFQRQRGLVPDGIVGPKSWEMIDTL